MKKIKVILMLIVICLFTIQAIDVIKYYEKYSTTARYQLKQEVYNGNAEAIKYYEERYLKNGIELF